MQGIRIMFNQQKGQYMKTLSIQVQYVKLITVLTTDSCNNCLFHKIHLYFLINGILGCLSWENLEPVIESEGVLWLVAW